VRKLDFIENHEIKQMTIHPNFSNDQVTQATVVSPASASKTAAKRTRPMKTEELVQTSFRLPLSRWKKLQGLSIDERRSVQAILVSALEAEFSKRGLLF